MWKDPPQDSTQKTLKEEIPRYARNDKRGKRGDSSSLMTLVRMTRKMQITLPQNDGGDSSKGVC